MSRKVQMPTPPDGTEWAIEVRPGRTMPSEVIVSLRDTKWPNRVRSERRTQCGSFFDRLGDEWFFKSTVQRMATECLDPPEKPELRSQWLKEMGA